MLLGIRLSNSKGRISTCSYLTKGMKILFKKFLYATTIWELKKYRTEDEVYAEWIDGWRELWTEFWHFVFHPGLLH